MDEQNCVPGAGFGSGQPLDVLRPGPVLAGEADRVHASALRRVSDDELTGMIKAWRRLTSWATARELGAIAEFARRRPEEDTESDFARRARARRAASGPPETAKQAGPAQTAHPGGVKPPAQAAPADGTAGAAGQTQQLGPPQPTELPGLPGLPGQTKRFTLLRLLRLAGRARRLRPPRRLRGKLPPGGGPARSRAFPR